MVLHTGKALPPPTVNTATLAADIALVRARIMLRKVGGGGAPMTERKASRESITVAGFFTDEPATVVLEDNSPRVANNLS